MSQKDDDELDDDGLTGDEQDTEASTEMQTLNIDDLDVEELERRIELSSAWPAVVDGWLCGADCGTLCGVLGDPCGVLGNPCVLGNCGLNTGNPGGGGAEP